MFNPDKFNWRIFNPKRENTNFMLVFGSWIVLSLTHKLKDEI